MIEKSQIYRDTLKGTDCSSVPKIYLYFSNCSYQSSGNPICLNDISFSYSSTIAFNSIKTLLIHSFLFGYNNFNTSICENNFLFGDISNSLGILGNAGNDQ